MSGGMVLPTWMHDCACNDGCGGALVFQAERSYSASPRVPVKACSWNGPTRGPGLDLLRHRTSRPLSLSLALYTEGAADYLTVVVAQTALLQAPLTALSRDTLQLRASVDLVRALGGGCEDADRLQNGKLEASRKG